jgi:ArsR family metal-binding transcriptional regulator
MELYHTTDMDGISELNPTIARMDELIEQLDEISYEDAEHPDLTLVHNSTAWAITLYPSGIVTFENMEDDDESPRYMKDVSRQDALLLWRTLSRGEIAELKARTWTRS